MAGEHHRHGHNRRAKALNTAANADPNTRCWQCGLTLAQVRRRKPRAFWTAGHVKDGEVGGLMLHECSACNFSRGAARGNELRRRGIDLGKPPPTVTW
jgi:hypothetical protein